MAQAIISRRGGGSGYGTVKFENYGHNLSLSRSSATSLSSARSDMGATAVGNYALFGGGQITNESSYYSTVDTYTSSLTKSTATSLSKSRCYLGATTVGNYAIFAGGYYSSGGTGTYCTNVDAYNQNLSRNTPTALNYGRYGLKGTTVGDYAIFGPGKTASTSGPNQLDVYTSNLSKSTPTATMSFGVGGYAATTVGNYAIFAMKTYTDAFDSNLVKSTPTKLSVSRENLAATTVGDYALFAGGYIYNSKANHFSTVDVYTKDLVLGTATALSAGRCYIAATSVVAWALFGGGYSYDTEGWPLYYSTVDVYNNDLTRTTAYGLSGSLMEVTATTVGEYALFGGGVMQGTVEDTNSVTAYKRPYTNIYTYKDTKYKFQHMDEEATETGRISTRSIPAPVTGYIKFKNTTIS